MSTSCQDPKCLTGTCEIRSGSHQEVRFHLSKWPEVMWEYFFRFKDVFKTMQTASMQFLLINSLRIPNMQTRNAAIWHKLLMRGKRTQLLFTILYITIPLSLGNFRLCQMLWANAGGTDSHLISVLKIPSTCSLKKFLLEKFHVSLQRSFFLIMLVLACLSPSGVILARTLSFWESHR